MKKISCSRCWREFRVDEGANKFTCGSCVQKTLLLLNKKRERKLMKLSPKDLKKYRKKKKWTQEDLAIKLKIPIGEVRAFEQGKSLPCTQIAKLIEKNG